MYYFARTYTPTLAVRDQREGRVGAIRIATATPPARLDIGGKDGVVRSWTSQMCAVWRHAKDACWLVNIGVVGSQSGGGAVVVVVVRVVVAVVVVGGGSWWW